MYMQVWKPVVSLYCSRLLLKKNFRAKIKEPKALTDAVLMAWYFVAEEALSGGIAQKICDIEDLLNTAVHMGQAAIGQNVFKRSTIKHLKSQLYCDIINAFQSDTVSSQEVRQSIAQFDRKSKLWQSSFWARLRAVSLFLKNLLGRTQNR